MRMLTRLLALVALAAVTTGGTAAGQIDDRPGGGAFKWYVGGQGGAFVFETPAQSRGGMPMAGGHFMVTARRTALLLAVEHGFGDDEVSSFNDPNPSSDGARRTVVFNDMRKYYGALMAFPLKGAIQPFIGVGFGIITIPNVSLVPTPSSGQEEADLQALSKELGSSGFGSLLGGLQIRLGRIAAFGQYQISTVARDQSVTVRDEANDQDVTVRVNKLLRGPTHTFSAGLRFSLGGARETITSDNH